MDDISTNLPTIPSKPVLIELPRVYDPRGNLTFIENGDNRLPFDIQRVFWTYDVPAGESRGGHAHYTCSEFVIATSGSFDVNLFDGKTWQKFTLNRPFEALYVPPMYWRTLDNFASGSVCLAIAPEKFTLDDYIYDFDEFLKIVENSSNK